MLEVYTGGKIAVGATKYEGAKKMSQNNDLAEAIRKAREMAAKMTPAIVNQQPNGNGDMNSRKRPHDEGGTGGTIIPPDDGPQVKKPSIEDPQAVAQAAIAKFVEKVGAQLGLPQMMTVEIKIPNRMVGLVIGRGGEMITRLQAESGARIQVAPDGSEVNGERMVSICGSQDTIDKARGLIGKVVEDAGGSLTTLPIGSALSGMGVMGGMGAMGGGGGGMGGPSMDGGIQDVSELMIPANKVGLIIGKGGEMIKALQEKAGCKMQMIQDGPYANTPEKPLRMTGQPESCKKARELVLQLMEQKELEARGLIAPDLSTIAGPGIPNTIEIQVLKQMVGYVIGRGGEHINAIQNNCGVRLQFQNDVPGTEYRIATISGTPDGCERAKKWVEDLVAERQNSGFRPRLELPNPSGPGVQTVQFPVPSNKCGLIIGKGGDTIRQIQVQSGAHVELHRGDQPNSDEKLFNLRGTPQQIQLAQQLIRQKYENVPGGGGTPPYGPGSPYQGGQVFGGPQPGPMYGTPGGAPGGNPWGGQYPYQQAAAAAAQGQQQSDPNHQAAWAAYYQQLYAAQAQAQAQQGGQPGGAQQPQPQAQMAGAAASPEQIQAQWAEYYRQMGYAYYGQQPGQQGGQPGQQAPPAGTPGQEHNKSPPSHIIHCAPTATIY